MPIRHDTSPSPTDDQVRLAQPPDLPVPPRRQPLQVARTRAGAVWVGLCVGALVLVALVVFMLQNTAPVDVAFLGMHGSAPLALMLLIAGLGVAIVALAVGSLRIGQYRRRAAADRRSAAASQRAAL